MVRKWKAFLHFWKKTEIQFCNEILLSMDHWVCYKIPLYKSITVKIFIVIEKIILTHCFHRYLMLLENWTNCFFWHWGQCLCLCLCVNTQFTEYFHRSICYDYFGLFLTNFWKADQEEPTVPDSDHYIDSLSCEPCLNARKYAWKLCLFSSLCWSSNFMENVSENSSCLGVGISHKWWQ